MKNRNKSVAGIAKNVKAEGLSNLFGKIRSISAEADKKCYKFYKRS